MGDTITVKDGSGSVSAEVKDGSDSATQIQSVDEAVSSTVEDGDGTVSASVADQPSDTTSRTRDVKVSLSDAAPAIEATVSDSSPGTGGAGSFTQIDVVSNYQANVRESIWADGGSQVVTITLPTPSAGARVRVIAEDASAGVVVEDNSGEMIYTAQGAVADIQMVSNEALYFESNGNTWRIV